MEPTISQLIRFIREHGHNDPYYCHEAKKIYVVEQWIDGKGIPHCETHFIDPTLQAVRNWLGY